MEPPASFGAGSISIFLRHGSWTFRDPVVTATLSLRAPSEDGMALMWRILTALSVLILLAVILLWDGSGLGNSLDNAPEGPHDIEGETTPERPASPKGFGRKERDGGSSRSRFQPHLAPISVVYRVEDYESGHLIPLARVRIFPLKVGAGRTLGWFSAEADGVIRFSLPRTLDEEWIVEVVAPGYHAEQCELTDVFSSLESSAPKQEVSTSLCEGQDIQGRILDAERRGVPGLEVECSPSGRAVTDTDGEYRIPEPEIGDFSIVAEREGIGAVHFRGRRKPGDSHRIPDLVFGGEGVIRVRLQYVDGRPLQERELRIYDEFDEEKPGSIAGILSAEATTDKLGRAGFKGLSRGSYSLELKVAEGRMVVLDNECWLQLAPAVTASSQELVFRFHPVRVRAEFPERDSESRRVYLLMFLPNRHVANLSGWVPKSTKVDLVIPFLTGTRVEAEAMIRGRGRVSAIRTIDPVLGASPIDLRVPSDSEYVTVSLTIQNPELRESTSLRAYMQAEGFRWVWRKAWRSEDGRFKFLVQPGGCKVIWHLVAKDKKQDNPTARTKLPEFIDRKSWLGGSKFIEAKAGAEVGVSWMPRPGATFSFLFEDARKPGALLGSVKVSVVTPSIKGQPKNPEPQSEEDVHEGEVHTFDEILAPGWHQLRFEVQGYSPVTRRVRLLSHKNHLLRIRLEGH